MSEAVNKVVLLDERFFCDGPYAVLLSQSLGGSGLTPHTLAGLLHDGEPERLQDLLRRGVCLPIFFGYDCALERGTLVVVGELDEPHAQAWIGRLSGKLAIPCGKLVLLAGGGDGDELAQAVSGEPPDEHYFIYQTIDVAPGDYRVDVLAYRNSVTVNFMHEDLDDAAIAARYQDLPQVAEAYVVHLTPLTAELPLPALVDGIGWTGWFQLR